MEEFIEILYHPGSPRLLQIVKPFPHVRSNLDGQTELSPKTVDLPFPKPRDGVVGHEHHRSPLFRRTSVPSVSFVWCQSW